MVKSWKLSLFFLWVGYPQTCLWLLELSSGLLKTNSYSPWRLSSSLCVLYPIATSPRFSHDTLPQSQERASNQQPRISESTILGFVPRSLCRAPSSGKKKPPVGIALPNAFFGNLFDSVRWKVQFCLVFLPLFIGFPGAGSEWGVCRADAP